ncbi:MAG: hypothetical protein MI748_05815 [Opitutales bacterium]|nr:hypothetical protein [Opitutales bacterium]
MNSKRGIAVVPLIIGIVLIGVAGFSIYSWLKTKSQAQADKEVAEQRELELKGFLDEAQKEAEENAAQAAELQDQLTKTEEAMKLAAEEAAQEAEEKAAMIAELETKLEEEEEAKATAEAKAEELNTQIASLEESITAAEQKEAALRAALGSGPVVRENLAAKRSLSEIQGSVQSQQRGIQAIKALLEQSGGSLNSAELNELIKAFENDLVDTEKSVTGLSNDLLGSGEYSPSSSVGQSLADLKQSTQKQRAILNGLKSMIARSDGTIDAAEVAAMIADLESSITEVEDRQASLGQTLSQAVAVSGGSASGAMASLEQTLSKSRQELASLKRQLASAEAAKQAALDRQAELEKLSIEIKYDINYESRSMTYARRLHSMYNQVAHPEEEK